MSIVLIGGIDRLSAQYQKEARLQGMDLQIYSQAKPGMNFKIKNADAVVIFTNKISHHAKNKAFTAAKDNGIPVYMHHACGVCTLRECLKCVQIINSSAINS